jgi:hypothetical protein
MRSPPERRQSRRLRLQKPGSVSCRTGTCDQGPNLALVVLNLSEGGACLAVRGALSIGRQVTLTFGDPGGGRQRTRPASVAWCREMAAGASIAGFCLREPLSAPELADLAQR